MIDAGLSEKKLSARMALIERSFSGMDAVFATHEHSDHIRGIGPLLRKHDVPFFTTEGTWRRANNIIGKVSIKTSIEKVLSIKVLTKRPDPKNFENEIS